MAKRKQGRGDGLVIQLNGPFITLGQALKLAGLTSTGGAARPFLEAEDVRVNGERETRRGRKLVAGDVVQVGGEAALQIAGG